MIRTVLDGQADCAEAPVAAKAADAASIWRRVIMAVAPPVVRHHTTIPTKRRCGDRVRDYFAAAADASWARLSRSRLFVRCRRIAARAGSGAPRRECVERPAHLVEPPFGAACRCQPCRLRLEADAKLENGKHVHGSLDF